MFENLGIQLVSEWHQLGVSDVLTVLTLAFLEGLLSVDNALVLAILVRVLPKKQQKKALTYGIVGAFVFRFIALIFASYLMNLVVFKLLGAAYLIYIALKHMFFAKNKESDHSWLKGGNFWRVVLTVELTDIAFSIDSITTAVAMSNRLIVVWMGGVLGIVFLRFMSGFFIKLLEILPKLEDLAYQLILFIGAKLALEAFKIEIPHRVFWFIMALLIIFGSLFVWRDYRQRNKKN